MPGANSTRSAPCPPAAGATVDFRFRNGKQVHFEAHEILFTKLLEDVKAHISFGPKQLEWQNIEINDIGSRLVAMNQQQYIGRSVARWDLDLQPLPGHFDKRITVTTPLQKAGAYLLTAKLEGGNVSRIVVWLDDTVILKKPLDGQSYYFVADARTGQGVAGASVDFFGWRNVQVPGKNENRIETKRFAHKTDDRGQLQVRTAEMVDPQGNLPVAHHHGHARRPAGPPGLRQHLGLRPPRSRL